ncbi:MAG: PstS family phosphate ABC transporter substrate-binding protein [Acidobacteria bacterium]|nr:MAG: PstS family phosphate ABC transporter substrate-binding protein [Acidobacteriota bacterium]
MFKTRFALPAAALAAALLALPAFAQVQADSRQVQVDSRLPHYRPASGVSGTIKSVGSDTLNNLMTLWAEKFKEFYPNVQVEIEGKGSSTAPPALISGASNFGPMSREMKQAEIDEFEKVFGYKPTPVHTAIDMLAVYVHKDNPIAHAGLSLPQVDAIFSSTRKGGYPTDVTTWGQLGLDGEWANLPISLYGRNSASGTYGFFKSKALFKGDFKDSVKEQPGSSSVVQGVASDRGGIGYSGIGYKTADVAAVPLARKDGESPVPPTPANVASYPLARFLYVYVNKKPGTDLDPLRREFVKLILSREGQEVVVKDGYLPVSYEIAKKTLASVGIDVDEAYR